MTDTATTDREEVQEQELTQEQKDADAGLAAGFAKARGSQEPPAATDTSTNEQATDADREAQAKAQADADAKAQADAAAKEAAAKEQAAYDALPQSVKDDLARLKNLPSAVDKLAGHIGGLTTATQRIEAGLKAAKTAAVKAGGDAPTDAQIAEASGDPAKLKQLVEDFPDLAGPIVQELTSLRGELAKKTAAPSVDLDTVKREVAPLLKAARDEGRALARIDAKHENWEQDINTPEFKSWMGAQPANVQALADSASPNDAIRMLDLFADHRKQVAAAATQRQRNQRRLEGGLTPTGTPSSPTTVIPDEAGLDVGFKKARRASAF